MSLEKYKKQKEEEALDKRDKIISFASASATSPILVVGAIESGYKAVEGLYKANDIEFAEGALALVVALVGAVLAKRSFEHAFGQRD